MQSNCWGCGKLIEVEGSEHRCPKCRAKLKKEVTKHNENTKGVGTCPRCGAMRSSSSTAKRCWSCGKLYSRTSRIMLLIAAIGSIVLIYSNWDNILVFVDDARHRMEESENTFGIFDRLLPLTEAEFQNLLEEQTIDFQNYVNILKSELNNTILRYSSTWGFNINNQLTELKNLCTTFNEKLHRRYSILHQQMQEFYNRRTSGTNNEHQIFTRHATKLYNLYVRLWEEFNVVCNWWWYIIQGISVSEVPPSIEKAFQEWADELNALRSVKIIDFGNSAILNDWEIELISFEFRDSIGTGSRRNTPSDGNTFLYAEVRITNYASISRSFGTFRADVRYADNFNFRLVTLFSYGNRLDLGRAVNPLVTSYGALIFEVADRAVESDGSLILRFMQGIDELAFTLRHD